MFEHEFHDKILHCPVTQPQCFQYRAIHSYIVCIYILIDAFRMLCVIRFWTFYLWNCSRLFERWFWPVISETSPVFFIFRPPLRDVSWYALFGSSLSISHSVDISSVMGETSSKICPVTLRYKMRSFTHTHSLFLSGILNVFRWWYF